MLKYSLPILATALLINCTANGKGDTSCDTATDSGCSGGDADTDTDADGDPSFSASWSSSELTISIDNGSGDYTLGIAETDGSSDPWTGEDCYEGYTTGSGTLLLYCHPLSSTGGSFTTGATSTSDLDEDTETIFDSSFSGKVTYVGINSDQSACWTWGADTSYYSGMGCTEQ